MDCSVREYRQVYVYLLCPPPAEAYHFYVDDVILLSLILLYPDYLPCSYIPYIRSRRVGELLALLPYLSAAANP